MSVDTVVQYTRSLFFIPTPIGTIMVTRTEYLQEFAKLTVPQQQEQLELFGRILSTLAKRKQGVKPSQSVRLPARNCQHRI